MESKKRVLKAIEEIKKGNMIIMLDDEDRENEGDLVYAGVFSTPDKVNFMATHAKGLICVSIEHSDAKRLELDTMVKQNNSSYETAFTISVDGKNAKTGISTFERDETIKILSSTLSKPNDLVRPGHIFPLIGKKGGVLSRTGHTEGSLDICKLAGLHSAGVICEIMKDDGTMARADDLDIFAKKHNLAQVYISDLVQYRLEHESLIKKINQADIEFFGVRATKRVFKDHLDKTYNVISFGKISSNCNVKFHKISNDYDLMCNKQVFDDFYNSILYLQQNGGVLVFLPQETIEEDVVNMPLKKSYGIGAQLLREIGVVDINLLSHKNNNNYAGLQGFGLNIKKQISI